MSLLPPPFPLVLHFRIQTLQMFGAKRDSRLLLYFMNYPARDVSGGNVGSGGGGSKRCVLVFFIFFKAPKEMHVRACGPWGAVIRAAHTFRAFRDKGSLVGAAAAQGDASSQASALLLLCWHSWLCKRLGWQLLPSQLCQQSTAQAGSLLRQGRLA